jgi:hypothetical protein
MTAAHRFARLVSAAGSDNATAAFNSPVILQSIVGYNARAGAVYLKIYQLAPTLVAPAVTDTPIMTLYLPASSAFVLDFPTGVKFNAGLGFRLVTGSADNDASAVTAGDILGLNFLAA